LPTPHPNTSPAGSTCCRHSASRGRSAPDDSCPARPVLRSLVVCRPLPGRADKLPRPEARKRAPARPAEALRRGARPAPVALRQNLEKCRFDNILIPITLPCKSPRFGVQ
jgi:hypothetical protein